jgi:calnexin
MQNDILFDNIYIGHSVEDATTLQKETFDIKKASEKAVEEAEKPKKEDEPKSPDDLVFMDDPVLYMKEKFNLFVEIAKRDPVEAVKFVPEVAGALGVGALTLIVLLVGAIGGGAKAAPSKEQMKAKTQQAKDQAQKTKDQVVVCIPMDRALHVGGIC